MTAGAARRPLVAANWKMHFVAGEAARYLASFASRPALDPDRDVAFFVPAPLLVEAAQAAGGLAIGAQNVHWEDRGAFTGEVSAPMARAAGATLCLVGHSERRQLFHEDDAAVRRKLAAALRHGLRPLLCVGERLEERRSGRARETVVSQLRAALAGLSDDGIGSWAVAYEPVWAIGTGETATPELAAEMHAAIRAVLGELFGRGAAERTPVLYGGSVTTENADELMQQPEVDGLLVGGASLDPERFHRIAAFRAP